MKDDLDIKEAEQSFRSLLNALGRELRKTMKKELQRKYKEFKKHERLDKGQS